MPNRREVSSSAMPTSKGSRRERDEAAPDQRLKARGPAPALMPLICWSPGCRIRPVQQVP